MIIHKCNALAFRIKRINKPFCSPRTGFAVLFQERGIHQRKMLRRPFPLIDSMAAVGVGHHLKYFFIAHQFVHQHLTVVVMHIVIAGPMDVQ